MTDFDALDDVIGETIDLGAFGEAFRLVPRMTPGTAVNAAPVADPTRLQVEFVGTFAGAPRRAPMDRAPIVGTAPTITAAVDAFGIEPKTGDIIERMATSQAFEVRRLRRDTTRRFVIEVTSA